MGRRSLTQQVSDAKSRMLGPEIESDIAAGDQIGCRSDKSDWPSLINQVGTLICDRLKECQADQLSMGLRRLSQKPMTLSAIGVVAGIGLAKSATLRRFAGAAVLWSARTVATKAMSSLNQAEDRRARGTCDG